MKQGLRCSIFSAAFSCFHILLLSACLNQAEKEEHLARQYCGSCHLFPDPSLLDKKTWKESVLPEMAFRMGLPGHTLNVNTHPEEIPKILGVIPSKAMVTQEEWESIASYFQKNAPDSLASSGTTPVDSIHKFTPSFLTPVPNAMITLLKTDRVNRKLYAGTRYGGLYILDVQGDSLNYIQLGSPPSCMIPDEDGCLVLLMGIMDPNDRSLGKLVRINNNTKQQEVIIDSLQRPVHFEKTDLNADGADDILICAFGNYTGALLLYERSKNKYIKHMLNAAPGARKTIVHDFTDDGKKDILALFTQGDERLILYVNKGNMNFEGKQLLRFPPVHGSSYFDTADFNNDGHFDILYTNGDNADYSAIVKPYHGVRVYENDRKNNFEEIWSFQMPGASQAIARDFDKDGDTDIAAVSFFPDFKKKPELGFMYFENEGNNKFTPQTTPVALSGRWLLIDAWDHDEDGDEDILLGALNFDLGAPKEQHARWLKEKSSLMLLRNNFPPTP